MVKKEESLYKRVGGLPGMLFYYVLIGMLFFGVKACIAGEGGGDGGPVFDPACGTHTYIGC